eukprot:828414-Amphidinium_carterae.2
MPRLWLQLWHGSNAGARRRKELATRLAKKDGKHVIGTCDDVAVREMYALLRAGAGGSKESVAKAEI